MIPLFAQFANSTPQPQSKVTGYRGSMFVLADGRFVPVPYGRHDQARGPLAIPNDAVEVSRKGESPYIIIRFNGEITYGQKQTLKTYINNSGVSGAEVEDLKKSSYFNIQDSYVHLMSSPLLAWLDSSTPNLRRLAFPLFLIK